MSTLIGIILIIATVAYVVYPLFGKDPSRIRRSYETVSKSAKGNSEDDIEEQIMKMRRGSVGVCPKCGANNPDDSRYCRLCGTDIAKGKKNG